MAVPGPRDAAHRMDMGGNDFRYSSRQEVPDHDAAIIAADGQQSAALVEGASERNGEAIKGAVELLGERVSLGFVC